MLSIGMIGTTLMASTPLPEQKATTVIEDNYKVTDFTADVLSYEIAAVDVAFSQNIDFIVFEPKSKAKPNLAAVLVDVGWQVDNRKFKQIPYTEKLLENFNLNFKDKLLFSVDNIRDNC